MVHCIDCNRDFYNKAFQNHKTVSGKKKSRFVNYDIPAKSAVLISVQKNNTNADTVNTSLAKNTTTNFSCNRTNFWMRLSVKMPVYMKILIAKADTVQEAAKKYCRNIVWDIETFALNQQSERQVPHLLRAATHVKDITKPGASSVVPM